MTSYRGTTLSTAEAQTTVQGARQLFASLSRNDVCGAIPNATDEALREQHGLDAGPLPTLDGSTNASLDGTRVAATAKGNQAANVMLSTLFNDAAVLEAMCSSMTSNGLADGGLCDPKHTAPGIVCGVGKRLSHSRTVCKSCAPWAYMDKARHSSALCFQQPMCGQGEVYASPKPAASARGSCTPCPAATTMPSALHRCTACLPTSTPADSWPSDLPCSDVPLVWPDQEVPSSGSSSETASSTGLAIGLTLACLLVVVLVATVLHYRAKANAKQRIATSMLNSLKLADNRTNAEASSDGSASRGSSSEGGSGAGPSGVASLVSRQPAVVETSLGHHEISVVQAGPTAYAIPMAPDSSNATSSARGGVLAPADESDMTPANTNLDTSGVSSTVTDVMYAVPMDGAGLPDYKIASSWAPHAGKYFAADSGKAGSDYVTASASGQEATVRPVYTPASRKLQSAARNTADYAEASGAGLSCDEKLVEYQKAHPEATLADYAAARQDGAALQYQQARRDPAALRYQQAKQDDGVALYMTAGDTTSTELSQDAVYNVASASPSATVNPQPTAHTPLFRSGSGFDGLCVCVCARHHALRVWRRPNLAKLSKLNAKCHLSNIYPLVP